VRPGRNAVILFLAGVVVGVVVVGAVVVVRGDDEPPPPDHASSAYAFVPAWERSRQGTFVVLSEFHRETAAGGDLDSPVELVQRPPDYLRRQFGSVEGRLDDRAVGCDPDPDGQVVCRPTGERLDESYDETVEAELATFREYFFQGEHPLYRVTQTDDGCFDLKLTQLYPSPPYGHDARFCFDETTGAMSFVRIERDEGTDTTRSVDIRTDVADRDFRLTG
jgi:hypothetical protein